jgi:hypothetical protein
MIKYLLAILSVSVTTILLNTGTYFNSTIQESVVENRLIINPLVRYDFKLLRDTLYTMHDHYVEVNLATQHATLYSRDGSKYEFPISSGTKRVKDGVETKEGLFTIHWKAKKLHSVQFDSTLMLNWMGFNGGIGFHALLGTSYYKYLGKKNVSHGCVRLSREDAVYLYERIVKGTPVLVHRGNNAIQIAFGKMGKVYKYYSYSELNKILPERLQKIYNREYFISSNSKILIDDDNVQHAGLPIGDTALIPSKQNIKPGNLWLSTLLPEKDKLNKIINGETSRIDYLAL